MENVLNKEETESALLEVLEEVRCAGDAPATVLDSSAAAAGLAYLVVSITCGCSNSGHPPGIR
jgi:hypothetical protein